MRERNLRTRLFQTLVVVVVAVAAPAAASSAAPPESVTCVVGGDTWFSHAPKGTDSVSFDYYTLTTPTDSLAWTGGSRRVPTPSDVTAANYVIATFLDATGLRLGAAESSCS